MADDRKNPSRGGESVGRPTARDVPFTRGAGSESEPAPRGQRPGQLPRDPTYEAELAQVELAVLRDPQPKDDPSTKQGGRLARLAPVPESVTPESPAARLSRRATVPNPEPQSPSGRAVASGTLLSVGAVDPRGKTERTLETPRMFISQEQGSEVYFKPGKIPAVTVHQSIESETVKLSDSVDPRRAKTIPRLDRAALAHLADREGAADSEAAYAASYEPPSSLDLSSAHSPRWNQEQWDAEAASLRSADDGQIHASLSPFREQAAVSSFDMDGVSTRPEPLAARRSDAPEAPVSVVPDTSTVPTHRDLPAHRIEASQPPPPPAGAVALPSQLQRLERPSEGPTTSSIFADEPPERRALWINYAAFTVALLVAVVVGLWLTRAAEPQPAAPPPVDAPRAPAELKAPDPQVEPAPAPPAIVPDPSPPAQVDDAATSAPPSSPRAEPAAAPKKSPGAAPAASPRKSSNPKASRETIF